MARHQLCLDANVPRRARPAGQRSHGDGVDVRCPRDVVVAELPEVAEAQAVDDTNVVVEFSPAR
jgi:hypothetical protein